MENHEVTNGKRAMEEELIRGRDMANHLLEILALDKSMNRVEQEQGSKLVIPFVEDLVRKVVCSFTNTLLLLNTNNDFSSEVMASMTLRDVSSTMSCPNLGSVDETCRDRNILKTRNRRGCYKRKSIAPTWQKDSSMLIEDGYAWRKYGQKMTLHTKYLRSYYRCTFKNDQACQAIKHVQRIQDDPPLYRTTYYGHHTCKRPVNPEIILEPLSPYAPNSMLLSFNNTLQSKQEHPFPSSLFSSTKHEPQEVIHENHIAPNQLSTLENLLLYDHDVSFDYSRNSTLLSPTKLPVEFENVYEQFGF